MGSRRKGRILAFQALYSWDAGQDRKTSVKEDSTKENSIKQNSSPADLVPEGLLDFSWASQVPDEEMTAFSRLLVTGTIENIAAVDEMIQKHLDNWELKRLNKVDLAIMRMSVYTLMFQNDLPPSIIIDEAIDISKEYGTDDSFRFVNGVLDGIRKTIEKP